MTEDIQSLWASIDQVSASNGAEDLLKPPATTEQLDRLGSKIGLTIPKSLRESLLIHDGITKSKHGHRELTSFLYPLSCSEIESLYKKNSQRDAEAIEEEDTNVATHRYWIPLFSDIRCHQEIYIDARDGTILCKLAASSNPCEKFRYRNYEAFLKVMLGHVESGDQFEWKYDKPKPGDLKAQAMSIVADKARVAAHQVREVALVAYLEKLGANLGTGESVFPNEDGEDDSLFIITGTGNGPTRREANVAAIENANKQIVRVEQEVGRRHNGLQVDFQPKISEESSDAHKVAQTEDGELHSTVWKMYGSIQIKGRSN